jgi:TBC1 domain family member 20
MALELNGKVIESVECIQDAGLLSEAHHAKIAKIIDACEWKDADTLRSLSVSDGGLISDELRRQACQFFTPFVRVFV